MATAKRSAKPTAVPPFTGRIKPLPKPKLTTDELVVAMARNLIDILAEMEGDGAVRLPYQPYSVAVAALTVAADKARREHLVMRKGKS